MISIFTNWCCYFRRELSKAIDMGGIFADYFITNYSWICQWKCFWKSVNK